MPALISLRGITRRFTTGGEAVTVLDDVNLDIEAGEMIAIVGASGSGKSTLMNILGCLDRASAGTYTFGGRDISRLGPDQLAELAELIQLKLNGSSETSASDDITPND